MKEERNEWEENKSRMKIIREKQSTGEKDIEEAELKKKWETYMKNKALRKIS